MTAAVTPKSKRAFGSVLTLNLYLLFDEYTYIIYNNITCLHACSWSIQEIFKILVHKSQARILWHMHDQRAWSYRASIVVQKNIFLFFFLNKTIKIDLHVWYGWVHTISNAADWFRGFFFYHPISATVTTRPVNTK